MMKKLAFTLLIIILFISAGAQHKKSDTLLIALQKATTDTNKFAALLKLSRHYYLAYPDSAIIFAQKGFDIAEKNKWPQAKGFALLRMADAYGNLGDYVKSVQYYFKSLRAYESINDLQGAQRVNNNIGSTYLEKQDYKKALTYLYTAKKQLYTYSLTHKFSPNDERSQYILYSNIGEAYLHLKKVDSAEFYLYMSYAGASKIKDKEIANEFMGSILDDLGQVAILKGDKQLALSHFKNAVRVCLLVGDMYNLSDAYLGTAKMYHTYKQQDSAEYFAHKAIDVAMAGKLTQLVLNSGKALYTYYDEDHNLPEAYKYYKITTDAKDSLYSQDKVKQLLSLDFDEKQRQQDIAVAREQYRQNVRMYALIAGLGVVLLFAFIFWRNSKQRQKANELLQHQKEEIQNTLGELKTTQAQLVQSAKMASLGELTAGIAHEIQNPLNFVNNFSEVSAELVDEADEELKSGDVKEAGVILADIKQNLEKIRHHGKRADFIVK
ncbi:MAG: tetratricopeptide repeat protein, partial [Bacteroidetes bacterium]|nr:tetratricopeptide repeat protein [Bacteroidota bacterium]